MTAEETAPKTEETAVASATEEAPAKQAATATVSTRKLSAEDLMRSFEAVSYTHLTLPTILPV